MKGETAERTYRPTESKYKGGAREMYVTYELEQKTRGGGTKPYPKVKRTYIAGEVKHWELGDFQKRSGRQVHGVKIDYEQTKTGYDRSGFEASRDGTAYHVSSGHVCRSRQLFSQVVEVPQHAQKVEFHEGKLPERYHDALQDIR